MHHPEPKSTKGLVRATGMSENLTLSRSTTEAGDWLVSVHSFTFHVHMKITFSILEHIFILWRKYTHKLNCPFGNLLPFIATS